MCCVGFYALSSAALCTRLQQEVQERDTELKQARETILQHVHTEATLRSQVETASVKTEQLDATVLALNQQLLEIQKKHSDLQQSQQDMEASRKLSVEESESVHTSLVALQSLLKQEESKRIAAEENIQALRLQLEAKTLDLNHSEEESAKAAEEARRALESLTASSVESTEQLSAAKASVVSLEKQLASEQQQQAALRRRLDE